jgi:hypothetical protein
VVVSHPLERQAGIGEQVYLCCRPQDVVVLPQESADA